LLGSFFAWAFLLVLGFLLVLFFFFFNFFFLVCVLVYTSSVL